MGLRVTAAQAAWLVDRHERMVRWHIERGDLAAVKEGRSWRIDVDALEGIPGWRVNRERLAELQATDERTAASMAARIAELERSVRELRGRVARLEAQSGASGSGASEGAHTSAPDDRQAGLGHDSAIGMPHRPDLPLSASGDVLPDFGVSRATERPETAHRGPQTVTLADRGPGAPLTFAHKTAAAKWLMRHGVNSANTPHAWPGWPPAELTPVAALDVALAVWQAAQARRDWRVTWTLHRCDDPACVCQSMLEDRES